MLINPEGSPLSHFLALCDCSKFCFRFFFKNFQMPPKGKLFNVFGILQQTGFSSSPIGPPFTIFGIVRFSKMTICRLKLGSQYIPTKFFQHYPNFWPNIRNKVLYPYIRISNVISELYYVLRRRRRRIENSFL